MLIPLDGHVFCTVIRFMQCSSLSRSALLHLSFLGLSITSICFHIQKPQSKFYHRYKQSLNLDRHRFHRMKYDVDQLHTKCIVSYSYWSVTFFTCLAGFLLQVCHMFYMSSWFSVTGVSHVSPVWLFFFITGVSHVSHVRLVFSYRSVTCFACQAGFLVTGVSLVSPIKLVFGHLSVTCFTYQAGFRLHECHMFHLSSWFVDSGV